MDNLKRNLIIVGILALILVIVLIIAFSGGQQPADVEEPVATEDRQADISGPEEAIIPASVAPVDNIDSQSQLALERISDLFVERYGSYSNQNNFENITELEFFMTDKLKNWLNERIGQWQSQRSSDDSYYGINTKVLNKKVTSFKPNQGIAEVLITTQRAEYSGDTVNAEVFQQQVVLKFVQVGQDWKVDGIYWQE